MTHFQKITACHIMHRHRKKNSHENPVRNNCKCFPYYRQRTANVSDYFQRVFMAWKNLWKWNTLCDVAKKDYLNLLQ